MIVKDVRAFFSVHSSEVSYFSPFINLGVHLAEVNVSPCIMQDAKHGMYIFTLDYLKLVS